MLSRVANSLFWLARYLERAETAARFLGVTHGYAQELRAISHAAAGQSWDVAWELVTGAPPEEPLSAEGRGVLEALAFSLEQPNSLFASLTHARENARGIRDAISSEMWEELNILYLLVQEEAAATPVESSRLAMLQRVKRAAHLFQGLRDATMSRADEWLFLQLGQLLERADSTARVLESMCAHPAIQAAEDSGHRIDTLHLVATLRACTAFEAYSRREPSLTLGGVAGFLLLDNHFPRSVEFCVKEVGAALHVLSGTPGDVFSNEAEQRCGRLAAALQFAAIEEILDGGVQVYLARLLDQLGQLGLAVQGEYFR